MERKDLSDYVKMEDPQAVWNETVHLLGLMSKRLAIPPLEDIFKDLQGLFEGKYPGYRACNTEYHDLQHTTDTMLAMVRLMHGATIEGRVFLDRELAMAMMCALLHDTGYIQETHDREGTGAKYTKIHVERSIGFMRKYFKDRGFVKQNLAQAEAVIMCTAMGVSFETLDFESENVEMIGKMLGTGDLLGQMADRCYLEKLLFLFSEFEEGRVPGFRDELDLLNKTVAFYDGMKKRLSDKYSSVHRFMRPHFRERWGVDKDVYADIIDRQIAYLRANVVENKDDYRTMLRRGGLVDRIKDLAEGDRG